MAYTPREIKDRVAVGDDIFIVEDLGNNRIRLIPAPTYVSEPGTPVNKALLQPIEDELGRLSSTDPYTQLDHFINRGEIEGAQIAGIKNSLYRGKNLGTSYTSEQQSQVASGNFLDLWVGDYWVINGTRYYIAAFNYYLGTGDQGVPLTTNHITLVPAEGMYWQRMNPPETATEGGYANSEMRTSGLDQAKTKIYADFPGRVLTHRRYLCDRVTDGQASRANWFDSDVELMNEVMVFGSVVNGKGTRGEYNIGIDKLQLPLFTLRPDLIISSSQWWLRDVVSATHFPTVFHLGHADTANAGTAFAVRPVFSIS